MVLFLDGKRSSYSALPYLHFVNYLLAFLRSAPLTFGAKRKNPGSVSADRGFSGPRGCNTQAPRSELFRGTYGSPPAFSLDGMRSVPAKQGSWVKCRLVIFIVREL